MPPQSAPVLRSSTFSFAEIPNPVFAGDGAAPHNMPFRINRTPSPRGAAASGPAIPKAGVAPSPRVRPTDAAREASKKVVDGFSQRAAMRQVASTLRWTVMLHRAAAESKLASQLTRGPSAPVIVKRYVNPTPEPAIAEPSMTPEARRRRKSELRRARPSSARTIVDPREATAKFFQLRRTPSCEPPKEGRFVLRGNEDEDDDDLYRVHGVYSDDEDDAEDTAGLPFAPLRGSSAAISPRIPSRAGRPPSASASRASKRSAAVAAAPVAVPSRPTSAKPPAPTASPTATIRPVVVRAAADLSLGLVPAVPMRYVDCGGQAVGIPPPPPPPPHRHFYFPEKTVPIVAHTRQYRFL